MIQRASVGLMLVAAVLVAGCASRPVSAPVVDRTASPGRPASTPPAASTPATTATGVRSQDPRAEFYTVKRGDTLYNIALDSGHDYREIAEWNGLPNPNLIREGQVLRLAPPAASEVQVRAAPATGALDSRPLASSPSAPSAPPQRETVKSEPRGVRLPYSEENLALLSRDPKSSAPLSQPAPQPAKPVPAEAKPAAVEPRPAQPAVADEDDDKIDWGWPTAGRVITGFSDSSNKGLDIGGKAGQPVLASASGTVLYVGSGIRGYGKLIVIRHSKAFSTVYAHNNEILVKEGQRVTKGQKVAEMGNSDADQVKLHFEVRRLGKPTDPTKFLPDR